VLLLVNGRLIGLPVQLLGHHIQVSPTFTHHRLLATLASMPRFSFAEITKDTIAIWFSLDYLMDLIYLLDIVFHFRTGYLEVLCINNEKPTSIRVLTFQNVLSPHSMRGKIQGSPPQASRKLSSFISAEQT
jgi:hypothetical protein